MTPALLSLLGMFGEGGEPPVEPPVLGQAVGGGGRRRREEYHYVVIDGVDHRVSSPEQAAEILLQLRELAAKKAKRQARKAVVREKPVEAPRATVRAPDNGLFAQQLQAQVDAANARVSEQYAIAAKAAIAWHQRRAAEMALERVRAEIVAREAQEDDDIETLILLGVL